MALGKGFVCYNVRKGVLRMSVRQPVELLEKNKPRQARAIRTYEAILAAASELLVDVGVERISTNLIAERAGITVPALYRYFPNKYAVLNALAAQLAKKQWLAFEEWYQDRISRGDVAGLLDDSYELLKSIYDVTRAQPGGLEILQAQRAVAPLQVERLATHRRAADDFCAQLETYANRPLTEEERTTARLTIEMGHALILMTLEDDTLAPEAMLSTGADMIRSQWARFLPEPV
jgi:AcrR family transcriptional regulator